MQRDADFSGILGETFDLMGDGLRAVALFVLVVGSIEAAGYAMQFTQPQQEMFGYSFGFMIDANAGFSGAAFQLAQFVVMVVAQYLLAAALLDLRGRRRSGGMRLLALIGMYFVAVFAFALGFLLLIVPGIILLVRWSAATGYLIGARDGVFDSLGRSWRATKGHSWAIFFASLILLLGAMFLGGLVGGASGAISPSAVAIVSGFIQAFSTALTTTLGIAIYHLVAERNENIGEIFE